jgi:hypothetical protein
MRKIITALSLLLFSALAWGQSAGGDVGFPGRLTGTVRAPGSPIDETARAKFLNQEWAVGIVTFKNGAPGMKVPLIFDEFGEKLYYLQGNTTMEFNNPIASFQMLLVVKGDSTFVTFRNGFPPIHKNTGETFYQVLVDGKFQLLNCKAKTIGLYKDDVPEEQRKEDIKELLYAVFPDGQIMVIKKDKDYLYTLPKYGDTIKQVAEAKKLKLKQERISWSCLNISMHHKGVPDKQA